MLFLDIAEARRMFSDMAPNNPEMMLPNMDTKTQSYFDFRSKLNS